ncbi:MAG TPA: exodeoxyribonuclease VII small subunit [Candidatus Saccharimonadales bacterium]|nr:exodeoxyribonuclease VII small subunit [Candidatus Saccharimonadales bacterium]
MATKKVEFDYRDKATQLEQIVASLQNPDIQIDDATRLHAEGLKLITELEAYLNQAEVAVKRHVAS